MTKIAKKKKDAESISELSKKSVFQKDFVHQYSLSKTLRFELIPIGDTAVKIKEAGIIATKKENGEYKTFGKDYDRASNYKVMKRMLDEIHRQFMEKALCTENIQKKFKPGDMKKFYDSWIEKKKDKNSKASQKRFLALQKDLAKKLKEIFDEAGNQWKKDYENWFHANPQKDAKDTKDVKGVKGVKIVLKSSVFPVLKFWMEAGHYDIEENRIYKDEKNKKGAYSKEELQKIYDSFNKFHTYFEGFQKNRENIYNTSGDQNKLYSTSIAHRLFEENLLFHFQNIERWQTIKNSVKENKAKLKKWDFGAKIKEVEKAFVRKEYKIDLEEFFRPETFLCFFSQSGIDSYNQILGGIPAEGGKEKKQGLNEKVNLTRQQVDGKRKAFPPVHELYKQILSKKDKNFIDEFEDDKSMLEAIQEFHENTQVHKIEIPGKEKMTLLEKLKDDISDHMDSLEKKELESHKINRGTLGNISSDICGERNTLDAWWARYKEKSSTQKILSFAEVQDLLSYVKGTKSPAEKSKKGKSDWDNEIPEGFWGNYMNIKLEELIHGKYKRGDQNKLGIELAWKKLEETKILDLGKLDIKRKGEGHREYEQIGVIKEYLEACMVLSGFLRDFQIKGQDEEWNAILSRFMEHFKIIKLFNMSRNWSTKKGHSLEKIKINFENPTLLDGWDKNKEKANLSVLFEQNGLFYLGIMDKKHNKIFEDAPKASGKKVYRKMIYKQVSNAGKDIQNLMFIDGKVERKTKLLDELKETYLPKEIYKIKMKESYKKGDAFNPKSLEKFIDYYKKCAIEYWDWINFNFQDSANYDSFKDFTDYIEEKGYSITFTDVSAAYIDKKVEAGELYLFQIYNKDFSQKKGKTKANRRDNLHTVYWKSLFMKENLKNVVAKLNGQAEVFFRPASIHYSEQKKKEGHHYKKLKGKFKYPILKDKRFSQDKYLFHVPITLNFKNAKPSSYYDSYYNQKVNLQLAQNRDKINIIGIDRGEKHLLYFSIINQKGDILEQGSLNEIKNEERPEKSKNYHALLEEKEKDRQAARRNWTLIENIKELKAGYLSQVVHRLAQLIIKYNAVIVLEDLNVGFKRSRFKFEKQVYQKFEKALIDKLNYLVFKEIKDLKLAGHYLKAYQLTAPFLSFEKLGRQSGILFYTTASYTSTTDPVTGFLKNIYCNYTDQKAAQEFWRSFDSIIYNKGKERFEFTYTLGSIKSRQFAKEENENENEIQKKSWTVCSCVVRSSYDKKKKEHGKPYCVHEGIINLFKKKGIKLKDGKCYKEDIEKMDNDADFHKSLLALFNAIMNMRVTDGTKEKGTSENDFILSPVEPFFDSRKSHESLPENGDANGAYNIARKWNCVFGQIIEQVDQGIENPKITTVTKQVWQNHAQSKSLVNIQKKRWASVKKSH